MSDLPRNRVLSSACALAVLIALVFASPPAFAEGEITVIASKHENAFPKQIRFTVQAHSSSPITQVRLRYRFGYNQATGYADATFTRGVEVAAQYVWDVQRQYLPPGIELQYYWQIQDSSGRSTQTPLTSLVADDTRFGWQSIMASPLTLYWYKGDRSFAQALLDSGTRALQQSAKEIGVGLDRSVKIFIYASQADLLGALPPRGVEWTGGQAFPEAGIIVLTAAATSSGREYGLRTVPHELSHLITHAATDNPYGGVPQWLDEGLAMYAEGDLPQAYHAVLRAAAANGNVLSLKSLAGNFPTDAQQSLLGYAQSYSMVSFLLSQYGRDKMTALLAIFREGSTPEDAFRGAYGQELSKLEATWRSSIGAPPPGPSPTAAEPVPTAPPLQPGSVASPTVPSPAQTPAGQPAAGRSCFGGLLSMAGIIGGLLALVGRFRAGSV